jgi:peptidyl-prolyl cis-trans isomerase D
MLMRIREGFGRWVIIAILGLIAVSFVFWGVDFNLGGPSYAAKVNGDEIPLSEFERNLQAEQAQFLELYRIELDEDVRRQLRASVVDRLVRQTALSQRVEEKGYRISDERLAASIRSIPMFQIGGQFSLDAYRGQLAFQGLSPNAFEALQRQQLELIDLQTGIVNSSFVTPTEYRRFVELVNQRREVGYASFEVASFLERVEIDDEAVTAHYEQFPDRYMTEEAAALEYVELRRSDIAQQIEVSEAELEGYYARLQDQFRAEEERRASHILITAGPGESDAEAEARAEALAERIRDGEDFGALAAEHSDDPGTAASGGDLGWIGRGMLEGPFEDALYSMELGAVAGPVRSDFGWHIIRFDQIREGEERSFAEVRDELLEEYRNERADDQFFDRANQLADVAFDEYDDLSRVASQVGLPLQRIDRFPRRGDFDVFPNSAPVVDAVFGFDPLEIGLNSDLLELSDEHVAVVRVVERYPPEQRPFEDVAEEIRETLRRERAQQLAAEAAAAFAAMLPETLTADFLGVADRPDDASAAGEDASGEPATSDDDSAAETGTGDSLASAPVAQLAAEHGGTWQAPRWIQRADANVPTEILAAAFDLVPPAAGENVRQPVRLATGDQALLVLSGFEAGNPDALPLDRRTALQQQILERVANGELGGYATAVQEQARVTVPPEILDPRF